MWLHTGVFIHLWPFNSFLIGDIKIVMLNLLESCFWWTYQLGVHLRWKLQGHSVWIDLLNLVLLKTIQSSCGHFYSSKLLVKVLDNLHTHQYLILYVYFKELLGFNLCWCIGYCCCCCESNEHPVGKHHHWNGESRDLVSQEKMTVPPPLLKVYLQAGLLANLAGSLSSLLSYFLI